MERAIEAGEGWGRLVGPFFGGLEPGGTRLGSGIAGFIGSAVEIWVWITTLHQGFGDRLGNLWGRRNIVGSTKWDFSLCPLS